MILAGWRCSTQRKPALVPLSPPHIPHTDWPGIEPQPLQPLIPWAVTQPWSCCTPFLNGMHYLYFLFNLVVNNMKLLVAEVNFMVTDQLPGNMTQIGWFLVWGISSVTLNRKWSAVSVVVLYQHWAYLLHSLNNSFEIQSPHILLMKLPLSTGNCKFYCLFGGPISFCEVK